MATTLIRNGCLAGALEGLLAGRVGQSFTPTDYTVQANAADAIAAECVTRNAALGVPMADADNANIFLVCYAAARAAVTGLSQSATATDYLALANQIVASAKQSVAKLV
jgi:hypothetical protein